MYKCNDIVSPFCVRSNDVNTHFIMNLSSDVTYIKIIGEYKLSKRDFDDFVVYSNVSVIDVFDVEDFDYGTDIKINVENKISFNSERFSKFNINKIDGYNKDSLTINLPFKLFFKDDCLFNEEDDFNKLVDYISDINILNINFDSLDVVDKVIDVVYRIENKIGKKISFINCICLNRTIGDIEKLRFLEDDRVVKIWYEDGIYDCSVDEFIIMRKNLDYIINDVKRKNLSNFEKVIYVYDIVKKFNYSASSDNYSMDGRQLHKIFSTNNIVCSGYSRIVTEVLNELGIRSSVYKMLTKDNELHARSLVHIVDDVYNINSICSMEPTWESAIKQDSAYSLFLTPVSKLKEFFPKERFREDIDVLCGNKKISEISLRDRISLYQFFGNKDLTEQQVEDVILCSNMDAGLDDFCKAFINVRVAQGFSRVNAIYDVSRVVNYNNKLSYYLNMKMGTNINFFS